MILSLGFFQGILPVDLERVHFSVYGRWTDIWYGCGQLAELEKAYYQVRLMDCHCTAPYKISLRHYSNNDYSGLTT